jgi:hypothetical protein
VNRFLDIPEERPDQFAVLVDWRDGPNKGLVLQHPLFETMRAANREVPKRFQSYHLHEEELPDLQAASVRANYQDPLARDPEGQEYAVRWLADASPVEMYSGPTGFVVIVQESYDGAIGSTLERLENRLVWTSIVAAVSIVLAIAGLWAVVVKMIGRRRPAVELPPGSSAPVSSRV